MTTHDAPAGPASVTTTSATASVPVPAPPSWTWRRGALFLASALVVLAVGGVTLWREQS